MQPKGESTWLKSSLIWLSKIDWNRSTLLDKLKTAHSIFNHVCRASRKLDSTFSTETLLVLICCFVLLTSCLLFLICDVSSSSGNIFGIDIRFAELIACLVVCVGVLVLLISVDLPVSQVGHILIKNSLMQSTDALFDIAGHQASRSGHGSLRSNSRSHWETRGNLPHRAWPDQLFIQINEWSIGNVVLGYTKRYSAADIGCWLFHYWNGPVSQCNVYFVNLFKRFKRLIIKCRQWIMTLHYSSSRQWQRTWSYCCRRQPKTTATFSRIRLVHCSVLVLKTSINRSMVFISRWCTFIILPCISN